MLLRPSITAICLLLHGGYIYHRVHRDREELGSLSALLAGACTAALYVMVNIVQGGGRAPPTLTSLV